METEGFGIGSNSAAIMITPNQIAEAQRMAREWIEKHQR